MSIPRILLIASITALSGSACDADLVPLDMFLVRDVPVATDLDGGADIPVSDRPVDGPEDSPRDTSDTSAIDSDARMEDSEDTALDGIADSTTDMLNDMASDSSLDSVQDSPSDPVIDAITDSTGDPSADLADTPLNDPPHDSSDDAQMDTDPDGAGDVPGDAGVDNGPEAFPIRIPQGHQITCPGEFGGTFTFYDIDHVCQVDVSSVEAGVTIDLDWYVQAEPYSCTLWGSPVYEAVGAWTRTGGSVEEVDLDLAHYDFGGNHHNDWIDTEVDGVHTLLYHSSFGWGWRACAPPDCLIVCEAESEVRRPRDATQDLSITCNPSQHVDFDGCARASGPETPELPVICVQVNSDGSVPELLDPWESHAGYPDYPLLPCEGDI